MTVRLRSPCTSGKTLTAEAVAEHLERPLYVVGSEELPGHADGMEQSLKTMLNVRAAHCSHGIANEYTPHSDPRSGTPSY